MKAKKSIGILDSGVGGLTAVLPMQSMLPQEDIIYFGDTKRMPYGNKSKEEIIFLANKIIAWLEGQGVKAILLACNTISSQIDQLKSHVPIFSIIEAGCRFAGSLPDKAHTGLIATCATVQSNAYENCLRKEYPDIQLTANDSYYLPAIIDSQLSNTPKLNKLIKECIDPIMEKDPKVTNLILGCSHFPIIAKEIQVLYPNLRLIDPAYEQIRMLKTFLEDNELMNKSNTAPSITLYTTADTFEFAAAIKRLGLEINRLEKVGLLEEDLHKEQ